MLQLCLLARLLKGALFFIAATWTKFEAEASAGSISESASDSEMGLGIGFNAGKFRFIFDHVDDTDIFSIQYSF